MTLYCILNLVSDRIQNLVLIERIIIHGAFEQAYVTSNIINISTFYIYYIYRTISKIAVFWSQIFGHVPGVEANFEKIKNVITPVKNKVDDLKLGVEFFYTNLMKSVQ